MSEDLVQKPATLHDLTELSRERLGLPSRDATGPLATTAGYIRDNPWTALAGAAVLGVALVALSRRSAPRKLEAIRDWVGQARESLPSRREVDSFAESTGIPCFFKQLGRKLHLVSR